MQTTSSQAMKQELLRRLLGLAPAAIPAPSDPTNDTFAQLRRKITSLRDVESINDTVNVAFQALVRSLAGSVPEQVGAASRGSIQAALEEAVNQATQILSLANPASPVIAQVVAALGATPVDVSIKHGRAGLSNTLPADLEAIRNAAEQIAGAKNGGGTGGGTPHPSPHKPPKMEGDLIFTPMANPFSTTVRVRGGQGGPYTAAVTTSDGMPLVTFAPSGTSPHSFTLSAIAPTQALQDGDTSYPFDVVWTDASVTGTTTPITQHCVVDWEAWWDSVGQQAQPSLDYEGSPVPLDPNAKVQVYELRFTTENLPTIYTLGSDTTNVSVVGSAPFAGGLKVWVALQGLVAPATFHITVLNSAEHVLATSSDVPVASASAGATAATSPAASGTGSGTALALDPSSPQARAGGSFTVTGRGFSSGATAYLRRK